MKTVQDDQKDGKAYISSSAVVEQGARIGIGTRIWSHAHVRSAALIGDYCNIGHNVYIDSNAIVGNYCKLQNNVNIYDGVCLEDYVFCGPSMTFTNVLIPRCEYPRERGGEYFLKTHVGRGASFGALSVVVCGNNIGEYALIGSGAVVCRNVPDYALMVGNPARQIGWVCRCGHTLDSDLKCRVCGRGYIESSEMGLRESKGED